MGYMCDFCGDQRSMVYCRSDAACLCLSCDRNVHSANALSRRHSRTLVCERCNSQPAFIRCVEERISLCQNCDWLGHTGSTEASTHKKQAVNCYSGCPSAAELSTIWSFVLDIPSVGDSTCEKGMSLMSITDNSLTNSTDPSKSKDGQDVSVFIEENDVKNIDKSSDWMGSSAMPELRTKRQNVNSTSSKTCCPGTKASDLEEDDKFYEDFNMDEVDLNIENYEEIFGVALNDPEQLFGNDGIGSLFGVKDMSGVDLNHRGTYAAEIPMEKHEVNSSPTNEKEVLALELDLHPPNNTEVHDDDDDDDDGDDDDDDDDGDTADRPFIPNNTTDQGIDVSKAALLIGFFTLISGSMISVLSNLKDSGKTETNKAELTLGFKDIFLHLDKLPDAFYNILLLTIAFTVSTVLAVVSLWPIIKDRSFWYRTILSAGVAAFFLSFGYILKDKVPKFWLTATDSFSIPSFWLVWVYGFSLVLFAVTISSAAQLLSAQLLSAFRHVG